MTDPLEMVKLLKARFEQELDGTGLELHGFAISPTEEGGVLEVAIRVTPAALQTAEAREQAKIDADFEALMSGVPLRETDDEEPEVPKAEAELDELMRDWEL